MVIKELKKERVEARQEDIVITALCIMCGREKRWPMW